MHTEELSEQLSNEQLANLATKAGRHSEAARYHSLAAEEAAASAESHAMAAHHHALAAKAKAEHA